MMQFIWDDSQFHSRYLLKYSTIWVQRSKNVASKDSHNFQHKQIHPYLKVAISLFNAPSLPQKIQKQKSHKQVCRTFSKSKWLNNNPKASPNKSSNSTISIKLWVSVWSQIRNPNGYVSKISKFPAYWVKALLEVFCKYNSNSKWREIWISNTPWKEFLDKN